MEQDLIKFYENIRKENDFIYEDKDGNYSVITDPRYLIVSVSYLELDESQYQKALFNMTIDKKIKYNKKVVSRPVDKSTVTKKNKDKGTIIDKDVPVYTIWVASNPLGAKKSFTNKEDALEFAKETNKKYYEASK